MEKINIEYQYDNLTELTMGLRRFAEERQWQRFHSPKNLATALIVEAAELLEPFQWLSQGESTCLGPETKDQVALEIADVLIYLTRLADQLDIDMLTAVSKKMRLNAQKYPPKILSP
ncbi:nucleotide pyrophosphohydrolase [Desulfobulbus alkaliphilus]|uniref:nucleotide pyrophosphohydrolase n=1 Tax=Desulfobulbus alkaliphilus TaxID=869814 RepID=UPI0019654D5D|nr:nucleotide pyrophosphohydrolase [Desulfobulbus alkaliphilus]MBM9536715.1 nucleotide pyrophosphohydrolase [Desulfobulbus alkaliphilus]